MDHARLIGRTIAGQYRVDALLGKGGFGAVYRAWDVALERPVAIKTIHAHHAGQLADRFRREAKVQARLRHPATVRLLSYGIEPDGLAYAVLEFVEGRTLGAELRQRGPLDAEAVAAIFGPLLDALDEAHGLGIVHRDLKPGNIMLTETRRGREVRLLDFGIAKLLADAEPSAELTEEGVVLGTLAYMSPEQAGQQPIVPASDLYSLGCVLYLCVTGDKPYRGPTREVLISHLRAPPPPLPARVPAPLAAVIQQAMAKPLGERFSSAAQMKAALDGALDALRAEQDALFETVVDQPAWAASDPTPAPPWPAPDAERETRATRSTPRERRGGWAAALVAGLLMLVPLIAWLTADDDTPGVHAVREAPGAGAAGTPAGSAASPVGDADAPPAAADAAEDTFGDAQPDAAAEPADARSTAADGTAGRSEGAAPPSVDAAERPPIAAREAAGPTPPARETPPPPVRAEIARAPAAARLRQPDEDNPREAAVTTMQPPEPGARADSPRVKRPRPTPTAAEVLARIDRALEGCDRCDHVEQLLAELGALEPGAVPAARRRYLRRCRLPVRGSCVLGGDR